MNNTMGGGRPILGRRARAQWATNRLSDIISNLSRGNFPSEEIEDLIANDGADPNVLGDMGKGFTLLFKLSMMGRTEVEGVVHDNILKTFTFLLERPDVDVNISHSGALTIQ
jgi:hypothetical protein